MFLWLSFSYEPCVQTGTVDGVTEMVISSTASTAPSLTDTLTVPSQV